MDAAIGARLLVLNRVLNEVEGGKRYLNQTLEVTRLGDYAPGTAVNLEVDMMARYVVEYLRGHVGGGRAAPAVTREHLARHGFERKEGSR